MEEQKINTITSPISNLKINKFFRCFSSINIFELNKLIYLDSEDKLKYRKKCKSLDKFRTKGEMNDVNNFEIKIINFLNNKIIDDFKSKPECTIIINNSSNPVNTVLKSNNKKTNISKQEQKQKKSLKKKTVSNKKKTEIYSQNYDLTLMKERPPKITDLFLHDYSFNEKLIDKSNESFGKLSKETIPISFYNHLMISDKNKKSFNNKYFKTSITQRNKNKLLTIIYYSP